MEGRAKIDPPQEKSRNRVLQAWWHKNRGWVLVLFAEGFGACMSATARLLEKDESGHEMHVMQVIFVRMSITCILSSLYMWATNVPEFPLGLKEIRGLLVIRGMTGFFGLTTFYWGIQYLPLAEATVITFLTPLMIPVACAILFKERLSKKIIVASLISFLGVIIIAKPRWLFPSSKDDAPTTAMSKRTLAIIGLLLGSVTACVSYTIVRGVGHRAHALISVNYYAFLSSVGSALFLLLSPDIGFKLPANTQQWGLLFVLGISGFILQFLLTAGLQHDKSAVATSMMYSQILFALLFDKVLWGNVPGLTSMIGGLLVLASTIYAAIWGHNSEPAPESASHPDEEQGLLGGAGVVEHAGPSNMDEEDIDPTPANLAIE